MNDSNGLHAIFCIKTGQPVGYMDSAYAYHPSAVHPTWMVTDGQNLDTMQERDTRAYVAFCLGLVDQFWRSTCHKSRKRQEATEHHWSLVRAYELLGQVSDQHLAELSHGLCRFISYAPISYRILDQKLLAARRSADLLAESAVAGALLPAINKALVRTLVHAENFARAGASVKTPKYEIIPESITDAATGPSNIRAQRSSRDYQRNAKQNKLMAEIMGLMGWSSTPAKRPQSSALLSRLSKHGSAIDANTSRAFSQDNQERDMLDELERIMQGGSYSSEYDESEDDTVEVRTIPRALVESMSEPQAMDTPQVPVMHTTTARLSLLERLRRNQEGS
jgi:hypothetical protein